MANFETTENYDLGLDTGEIGLMRRFAPAGYLQLEGSEDTFNIIWSSDMNPLEVLQTSTLAQLMATATEGELCLKDGLESEGTAQKVFEIIRQSPHEISRLYVGGPAPQVGFAWYKPRRKFRDTDVEHCEAALLVAGPSRAVIRDIIAATAIEAVREAVDATLDEFAADIPLLRQT